MKMTLLEIVTDILNDMDSDEVNSINDTIESQQVAQIVKSCFYGLISNRNWPHLRKLAQLDALGDVARPNFLKIPEAWKELKIFKYDKHKSGDTRTLLQDVEYKEPDSFLRYISSRNSDNSNIQTVSDFSGVKLLIVKDQPPTYWTSFDDVYIITDAYDVSVDSTLQKSKTQCVAYVEPSWTHLDSFIPDLPSEAFIALLEEAKSTAFISLKQVANAKAENKATKQQRWLARKAWTAKGGIVYPDYGRKGRR